MSQSAWAHSQPRLRGSVEWCTDLTPLHSCTPASLPLDLLRALDHSSNALALAQAVPQNRLALDRHEHTHSQCTRAPRETCMTAVSDDHLAKSVAPCRQRCCCGDRANDLAALHARTLCHRGTTNVLRNCTALQLSCELPFFMGAPTEVAFCFALRRKPTSKRSPAPPSDAQTSGNICKPSATATAAIDEAKNDSVDKASVDAHDIARIPPFSSVSEEELQSVGAHMKKKRATRKAQDLRVSHGIKRWLYTEPKTYWKQARNSTRGPAESRSGKQPSQADHESAVHEADHAHDGKDDCNSCLRREKPIHNR